MTYALLTVLILIGILILLRVNRRPPKEGIVIKDLTKTKVSNVATIVKSINDKVKLKITTKPPEGIVFVMEFKGNLQATQVECLRKEISAVLDFAKEIEMPKEVIVKLDSPGGTVTGYGLAASQLDRIRKAGIPLTVCIDQVAASGGYMMATVANKVVSSPFAVIGSIGVVMELPNFAKLLKKVGVEYKQYTAGEYKRLVSPFVTPEEKDEEKTKEKLAETHTLFKRHIQKYRPQVNIDEVATGETWYGEEAIDKKLVDEILTFDDYVRDQNRFNKVLEVKYVVPEKLSRKLSLGLSAVITNVVEHFLEKTMWR